jgi:putative FmdB family regulatory protein
MPLYEYACLECSAQFEKLLLSRDTRVVCPSCQSTCVEKLMSVFGFRSRGGSEGVATSGCSGCTSSSCATCK